MVLFSSFWQAGYEGADHINRLGVPLSMNEATGHLERAAEDYGRLKRFDIATVRESVGWRLADRQGQYDFSSVAKRMIAAREHHIQVSWTVCHYGWPTELSILDEDFVPRFAQFCGALARFLKPWYRDAPVYSPVNEISFTSWALSVGFIPSSEPSGEETGHACKRQLVRAAIAACDAIWQADSRARILHCDPIIHLLANPQDDVSQRLAAAETHAQYQAWNMLCGKEAPELGGAPRYLDIIGANYYHNNQWQVDNRQPLPWHLGDARRKPLFEMLAELHQRYQRPLLLAETSHVGSGRGAWINHIATEVAHAQLAGADILGICVYPILDRPDWEDAQVWHRSGLWEPLHEGADPLLRKIDFPYAHALRRAQRSLAHFQGQHRLRQAGKGQTVNTKTLIVFSHLRWDFVWQRPQHLLTRLAQHYPVVFIEEPVFEEGAAGLHLATPAPNVTVIRPHSPVHAPGFHDEQIAQLQPLMTALSSEFPEPIIWFYTPMALPLAEPFHPTLMIYDCMDELSAFKNAPRQLLQRESALLTRADLVFTGGPSLYAAKQNRHNNVWCFPSSVDAVHFEQALDRQNAHPLQDEVPHPRLGYYGVIDERIDCGLIAALADANPAWQIVMVGPVVKIEPASLPQRANIHYFGQQPYQALPQFLAGWDVCLMPFALNASTRYISPTKVLEYMAASLPIVSTAITDVKVPYGDIVCVADDQAAFIRGCQQALALSDSQRQDQAQRMKSIINATSWDSTVDAMHKLIAEALRESETRDDAAVEARQSPAAPLVSRIAGISKQDAHFARCLILGAGPTGLSAALHIGNEAVLLEKNATVGGWCRSVEDQGFTFDYAGHIMFSADPYVLEMYELLLKDNLHWQDREAWVYSQNTYTRYPFQGALYGLPAPVIKECILGAVEAQYNAANRLQPANASALKMDDCCGDGAVPQDDCTLTARDKRAANFEQFIYQTWGAGIAKYFAVPYNQKLWKVPLSEMETSWLGGRVPLPDIGQIIDGVLAPSTKPVGPNARFGYPLRGGFQALMSGFLPLLKGKLETNAKIIKLLPREHIAVLADGRRYRYEQLISTMPLPVLVNMLDGDVPAEVLSAARGLRHTSVRCVNLGIGRSDLTEKHWVYYPEETIFHRIFVQGNASPYCNPPGGCGLTCEITYSQDVPLPVDGQALIDRCIEECIRVGMINADDEVLTANLVDIPYAYVIYDHARAANVETVRQWLLKYDVILAGRYSEWEYYNSDHAFLAGKKAAEKVASRLKRVGAGM
ncbi:FAD-dependent oxidoreductase [Atlantibacter subterraneus]|uniref:FAD-dependent oxidoreductase n=1 Tax=Atlantibacter subterraneus TaxID=255519 RepID=UPI0028A0F81D|nr:FAD-dependent oxidoreductase [Atlantibacter subterranea]